MLLITFMLIKLVLEAIDMHLAGLQLGLDQLLLDVVLFLASFITDVMLMHLVMERNDLIPLVLDLQNQLLLLASVSIDRAFIKLY